LKRTIQNKACDLMRKRRDAEVSIEDILPTVEQMFADGEDRWEKEWQDHILKQALDDLRNAASPLVYQAFSMLSLENMSGKEVAETLGISTNAVYVYKHEALKKLKTLIEEAGE
jgi:RNA polymerase sigma factor, sigma-70 family